MPNSPDVRDVVELGDHGVHHLRAMVTIRVDNLRTKVPKNNHRGLVRPDEQGAN